MTPLRDLPELGIGCIYWPVLDALMLQDECPLGVIEVEPQPFWFPPLDPGGEYRLDERAFRHLQNMSQPKLVHGVGFPIGGTVAPDSCQVEAFARSIRLLDAPWASEHLSFTKVRHGEKSVDTGFLLPPTQTAHGISVAVDNIRALQEMLPVPFIFETGVNYLAPQPGEMPDGTFFASVALNADCGILLDLHNVWTNELNGRQAALDVVSQLPLERVIEIHLAGGQEFNGYWVDAHSGLVSPRLLELARQVVPQLPNLKAIIFEIMPQYVVANSISLDELTQQMQQLNDLWNMRGRDAGQRPSPSASTTCHGEASGPSGEFLPAPDVWEGMLASTIADGARGSRGAASLGQDEGIHILRKLISAARAGRLAETLPLTTRVLLLTLGEARAQNLLDDFWRTVPVAEMNASEAEAFVRYARLNTALSDIPYLHDVTELELASHRALITGRAQSANLHVDPHILIQALRQGRLPDPADRDEFHLTVSPPTQRDSRAT